MSSRGGSPAGGVRSAERVWMPLSALTPAPARMKMRSVGETGSIYEKCRLKFRGSESILMLRRLPKHER